MKASPKIMKFAYADISCGGRPGIDPAVYFKKLIIGILESLPPANAPSLAAVSTSSRYSPSSAASFTKPRPPTPA